MPSLPERILSLLRQEESIEIEAESASSLSLRHRRIVTVFDLPSRSVAQHGKTVAAFGAIQNIRIKEITNEEGPMVWAVSLQVRGARDVLVGRATDNTSASIAAAHIATITGSKVLV
jgi:hypothetical protein